VNSHGQIVGRSDEDGLTFRAVLWERRRIYNLNDAVPPDSGWSVLAEARDINDKGEIVGYGGATNGLTAFLLIPGKP
jgi:hypothetical protein